MGIFVSLYGYISCQHSGLLKAFLYGEVRYCAESLLGFSTALLAKERHDHAILLTLCRCSYMYMCMQVHDSGQHQCKQDQHYTQAVSSSWNRPNGDG